MQLQKLQSKFLHYLIENNIQPGENLPPINNIAKELEMSPGKVRENLEVARQLGFVSVKPRVGIVRQPLRFAPSILQTMLFGLGTGEVEFSQLSQLRQIIEAGFWDEAVSQLQPEDITKLKSIIEEAWKKLRGTPVHVPNSEHRALHLLIFSRLQNPLVQGILSTYWDAYDASELTRFAKYQYWLDVWEYHERIVCSLEKKEFDKSKQLLIKHFALLASE